MRAQIRFAVVFFSATELGGLGCGGNDTISSASTTAGSTSSTASSGGGGASATASTSSTGGAGPISLGVGHGCATDVDCDSGLTCVTPTEGVAGGYCTKTCTGTADCPADATCSGTLCYRTCTFGTPPHGMLDPNKCYGRSDIACTPTVANMASPALCLPSCGTDSQCPSGHCDLQTGFCTATAPPGDGIGTACDHQAMPSTCAGQCLLVTLTDGTTSGFCSDFCVEDGDPTVQCGGPLQGACLFTLPIGGVAPGAGDSILCASHCTQTSDCGKGLFCFTRTDAGSNGYCLAATACPNGNADCAIHTHTPGITCVQSSYGPICEDSAFPSN